MGAAKTWASADDSLRRATLAGWVERRRVDLLDRSHAYGGWMDQRQEYGFGTPRGNLDRTIDPEALELYDRGVFRHLTPNMDREYRLDLWAYRPTGGAAYRWNRAPSGLQMYAGSIERTTGAVVTRLKQSIGADSDHRFTVRATLEQDATGRRALVDLGYRWRVGDGHAVGARHTFSEYKADLDATLFYDYRHASLGRARAAVTFQNLYNDFLYGTLGTSAGDELLVRRYDGQPLLLEARLQTPDRYRFRTELHAAFQPERTRLLTSKKSEDFRFRDDERVYYVAALAEYRFPYVTAGAFYRRDATRLRRRGSARSVTADYRAEQIASSTGVYLLANWWRLHGEAWGMYTAYSDHQRGSSFGLSTVDGPLNYHEPHRSGKLRVEYRPPDTGPSAGLEYVFVQRTGITDGLRMTREWTGEWFTAGLRNYRLALLLGYRFERGSLTLGVGYDTDNDDLRAGIPDSPGRFDNGFGRLTIFW
jgi:hypothetical protein